MVSPMTQTFETSTLHIDESHIHRELPNDRGNSQLTRCDEAGAHDPTVAVYLTPKGDFYISEQRYEYGTLEQYQLSHTLGAIAVDSLPKVPTIKTPLRTVA